MVADNPWLERALVRLCNARAKLKCAVAGLGADVACPKRPASGPLLPFGDGFGHGRFGQLRCRDVNCDADACSARGAPLAMSSAMGEPSRADGDASRASQSLDIAVVEAPIALCTATGELRGATRPALALLRRASALEEMPGSVPPELWRLLERTATGEAVEWRGAGAPNEVLGCTRYAAAPGCYLLLMREVSSKRLALAELLQRQQKELTERLIAGIARDIRGSVASIVYSADFLNVSGGGLRLRYWPRPCATFRRLARAYRGPWTPSSTTQTWGLASPYRCRCARV